MLRTLRYGRKHLSGKSQVEVREPDFPTGHGVKQRIFPTRFRLKIGIFPTNIAPWKRTSIEGALQDLLHYAKRVREKCPPCVAVICVGIYSKKLKRKRERKYLRLVFRLIFGERLNLRFKRLDANAPSGDRRPMPPTRLPAQMQLIRDIGRSDGLPCPPPEGCRRGMSKIAWVSRSRADVRPAFQMRRKSRSCVTFAVLWASPAVWRGGCSSIRVSARGFKPRAAALQSQTF